jgi:hypothetical protein
MRNYREYLRVPASYWLLGGITMATMATILWGGFSLAIGAAAYVVLLGEPAVALVLWGRSSVEVTHGELRAGPATMPLAQAGQVQALDAEQTRQLRGPMADPAAFMLIRPYLRYAVYIEVTGDDPARPYWLIGTRHPEALAAAIDRSRPQARADDPSVA